MIFRITKPKQPIKAIIQLPASKSICNRALVLNALSYSPYDIKNLSDCDDTQAMLRVLNSNTNNFDIGAAGTAMRFLTAFLSKVVGEWTITGTERMKNRPIGLLVDALNSVGARIEYIEKEGFPPLRIFGSALQGGKVTLSGSVSSQYISALLMVAPLMENGLELHLTGNIISLPYIQMTLGLMKTFGVNALFKDNTILVTPQEYHPAPFTVEADWSAASYWYEIVALAKDALIELPGLSKHSLQGDSACRTLFAQAGAQTSFVGECVTVEHSSRPLTPLIYDFVQIPDLAQTLTVVCALSGRPFRFTGLQSLRIKETDRIQALITELEKLGYILTSHGDDTLEWNGEQGEPKPNPVIDTYEDHRMAMAFTPIALLRAEGIAIANPQVVSKSYPGFWKDLEKAGFTITAE